MPEFATHDNLLDAIARYLGESDPGYALLLDGSWGSGKTYFWKNSIVPLAEALEVPQTEALNIPQSEAPKYRSIYLSLYGIESVDQISSQILYSTPLSELIGTENAQGLTNWWQRAKEKLGVSENVAQKSSTVVTTALRAAENYYFGIPKTEALYQAFRLKKPDPAKLFLCVDDLERISPNLKYQSLAGYLNSFVEHYGMRLLIVGNLDQIPEDDKKIFTSRNVSEKFIRYSYRFHADIKEYLAFVIPKLDSDTAEIISRHRQFLFDLWRESGTRNLRTIKKALNVFQDAWRATPAELRAVDRLELGLLHYCSAVTCAVDSGILIESNLKEVEEWNLHGFHVRPELRDAQGLPVNDPFEENFLKPFGFGDRIYSPTFASIYVLIREGYLDRDNFRAEIEKVRDQKDTAEQLMLSGEFDALDDTEAVEVCESLIQKVRNGDIENISRYNTIAARLLLFARDKLIPYTPEQICSLLNESLDKATATRKLKVRDRRNRHAPSIGNPEDFPGLTEFHSRSKLAEEKRRKEDDSDALVKEFHKFVQGDTYDFAMRFESFEWDVFEAIPVENFVKALLSAHNSQIRDFRAVFGMRYKRPSAIREEIDGLEALVKAIPETPSEKPKLSDIQRNYFRNELESCIETLRRNMASGVPMNA